MAGFETNIYLDCESGVESSIVKLDTRGQTELRKVKKLLNNVKGKISHIFNFHPYSGMSDTYLIVCPNS